MFHLAGEAREDAAARGIRQSGESGIEKRA
jgi:hypothetical protein